MSGAKVLIAEDDAGIRTVVSRTLQRQGYEVQATSMAAALWKWIAAGEGDVVVTDVAMPDFLGHRGADGWPDLSLGGPGFCFPVQRWNGKAYALNRFEYEGKRCKGP